MPSTGSSTTTTSKRRTARRTDRQAREESFQRIKERQASSIRQLHPTRTQQLVPIVILGLGNIVGLTLWTTLDPLHYVRQEHPGTDYWNRPISTFGACRSPDGNAAAYLIPLATLNLIPLLWASHQAVQARHLVATEIQSVGWAVASLFQAYLTGIPIAVAVRDIPKAYYFIMTTMIFLLCMAILGVIFVPRIIKARNEQRNRSKQHQGGGCMGSVARTTSCQRHPIHSSGISYVSQNTRSVPNGILLDSKSDDFGNPTPPLYSEVISEQDPVIPEGRAALQEREEAPFKPSALLPRLSHAQIYSQVSELTADEDGSTTWRHQVPVSPPPRRQGSGNASTLLTGCPRAKPLYSDFVSEEGSSLEEKEKEENNRLSMASKPQNHVGLVKPLYSETSHIEEESIAELQYH